MPSFLSGRTDDCCCPEMKCCTPETVTATVNGFSGTIFSKWTVHNVNEWTFQDVLQWPSHQEVPWIGAHSAIYEAMTTAECLPINQTIDTLWETVQLRDPDKGSLFLDTCDMVWSSIAFPPSMPSCSGMVGYGSESDDKCTCLVAATKWQQTNEFIADPDWDGRCIEELCGEAPGGDWHYGPVGRGDRVCEDDINGDWVCHRITTGLRPELHARVVRSSAAPDNAAEARLRFDVYCRRRWGAEAACNGNTIIKSVFCGTETDPETADPDGTWYCVDYYCGPRNYGPMEGFDLSCDQYQCTAAEGFVWPHLKAQHDENNSASLKLTLEPAVWDSPNWDDSVPGVPVEKSQYPYSWRVSGVSIDDGGDGYSVGEFFVVDFDPDWMEPIGSNPPLTGQQVVPLPDFDPFCGFNIAWEDEYGATEGHPPGLVYSRLGCPTPADQSVRR